MKSNRWAVVLLFVIYFTVLASAQNISFESSSGAFALPELVRTLWANKWRVSFEDAPTTFAEDLEEIQTRTGVKILQVRGKPLKLTFNINENAAPRAKAQVLQNALTDHRRNSGLGEFTVVVDGDYMHVVPASFRGKSGKIEPFLPMLDTRITVQTKTYVLQEYVMAILHEVSRQRGVPIALGTVPLNLFNSATLTDGANNEPARIVLVRAFSLINGPRYADGIPPLRLTWRMAYGATGQMYFFNVSDVPAQAPVVSGSGSNPGGHAGKGSPPDKKK